MGLADKSRDDYTMRKYESVDRLKDFFNENSARPEIINPYLSGVCTAPIENRKRFSDLISRPQVSLVDMINFVPRGTFTKNSINLDDELSLKSDVVLKDNKDYKTLISSTSSYDSNKKSGLTGEDDRADSYMDAVYVLRNNTGYPVANLSADFMTSKLELNYKSEILEDVEIAIKYAGYIERERKLADKIMRLENLVIPENFDFDKVQSLSIECRQKLKRYSPRTIAQASRISGVSPADISVLLVYFGR